MIRQPRPAGYQASRAAVTTGRPAPRAAPGGAGLAISSRMRRPLGVSRAEGPMGIVHAVGDDGDLVFVDGRLVALLMRWER